MPMFSTLRRTATTVLAGALLAGGMAAASPASAAQPAGAPAPAARQAAPAAPAAERPTDPIAHDPTMAKEGSWYYVAITGDAGAPRTYLPLKRSKDLVHWEELGPVFTELPGWVVPTLGIPEEDAPRDLWAPDLVRADGEWRLYYAASQFGVNNSVIGLATTPTLDPDDPDYGWVDQGLVLQSTPGTAPEGQEYNAIDPNYVEDADGGAWLTFGSFWTGIKMRALDPETGKLSAQDTTLYDLAQRPDPPDAVEGPSIIRHGDYYYLFVSFDYCCRGIDSSYRVVVGRSADITGPYVDAEGVPLLEGGGTEVLRGYDEFVGTGHPDVLEDPSGPGDPTVYFVNHYYDATDDGAPRLNVRTLSWEDGWPVVSDPLNPSRYVGHGAAYVTISPRGSDAVVEDVGCGYEGADVALGAPAGGSAAECQQWQVLQRGNGLHLLNRHSNAVAEVAGCVNADGATVAQWSWLANDCQRWTFATDDAGWTTVSSVLPGSRAWAVAGCDASAGSDLVVDSPSGGPCQQFRFEPVGHVLLASTTDPAATLSAPGCRATGSGTPVRFRSTGLHGCEEWRIDAVEEDASSAALYTVTDVASGQQLATSTCRRGGSPAGAGKLVLVTPTAANGTCRTWTLAPTDDGSWTLGSQAGTDLAVRLARP